MMKRKEFLVILCSALISLAGCQTESSIETIPADGSSAKESSSLAVTDQQEASESSLCVADTTEAVTKVQPTTVKEMADDETLVSRDKSTYTDDLTYDMMARYPDECEEKPFKSTGKIVQVVEENFTLENGLTYSAYRFSMGGNADETIMVMLQKDNSMAGRLLENDEVTFYGAAWGMYSYETVMGNTLTIPLMIAVMYDFDDGSSSSAGGSIVIEPSRKANITETVVYEENGIKVTAKSIDYSGWMGPELKLNVENNSGQNITIQARNASVNGYMMDQVMSIDVNDGKKANDEMSFYKSAFEVCGIKTIADIEFSLHIFNSDTWDTIDNSPLISLKTDAAEGFEYSYDETGDVLYDEGGIKIIAKGISDSLMGKGLDIFIINNSGQNICVQARDTSVNGYMVDATISSDVLNGKYCMDTVDFFKTGLEKNDISTIEEIQLYFHIFNMESWEGIVDTPVITWKAD